MVGDVEAFHPELQTGALAQRKYFQKRKIQVAESRPASDVEARVSKALRLRSGGQAAELTRPVSRFVAPARYRVRNNRKALAVIERARSLPFHAMIRAASGQILELVGAAAGPIDDGAFNTGCFPHTESTGQRTG